ncbi:4a-hydroxytetrahydrobiopterin dehydratase [Gemmobacter denitrificans]|uniref:Putative pterin-4-alpha-carbinolamine dehydratase n=1 Tax=Gemmobacter denitrificans TaxID=3123040 RepID=A0ABU8BTD3_9RHOB
MTAARLTGAERQDALPALTATGWQVLADRDAIRKVWKFRSFSDAWGFMSRVALACEKANHHPEWRNVYNIVDVTLVTHDCDGLSALDLALAQKMDRLAGAATVLGPDDPLVCACQTR